MRISTYSIAICLLFQSHFLQANSLNCILFSCTALFLQNFVGKKVPFAHIDIAGPVWDDKIGATGFGAKLVTEWVCRQGKEYVIN